MVTQTGRRPLRLIETFRSIFYTPIYVSLAGGFLEKEGLDVSFATCPPEFAHPLSALNRGGADIAQSGIMRSIISSDWGAETVPVHFAKINSRDGFFVLSRAPQEGFRWESLKGAKVIPVGFSPMPWASFQFALRKHGVDPSELELLTGLSLDEAIAAFRENQAGFIHVPQPAAEQLLADGDGYLVAALGPENGHIAYSSFAATNGYIEANEETVHRFIVGFSQALKWLAASGPSEIAEAVAQFFPETSKELVVASAARLKGQDTWSADAALRQPEYEALHDILLAAGLCRERQPYAKVVRTDLAETALAGS
ncbi:MAG: hypothetical protein BZY88_16280 [SAR202 cluster bacterium Io17-Chloro-G9]|nr:MAG: hypothetical protein BZY88_16280 [SAR202 cluster bacterium Io17-Chloro-G9]